MIVLSIVILIVKNTEGKNSTVNPFLSQREIARKLANPKQPTNPFLEMVKFLLERIAPVHIDSEAIR